MLPMISSKGYKPITFQDFFNEDFLPSFTRNANTLPAVNIKEDEKAFKLEIAVPGIDKKDLKIDLKDDTLTIASEHKDEKEEKNNGYTRREFSYNSFCRSFYLPENIDVEKIDATYKDGVLEVSIPKREEDKKLRSREVKIS